MKKYPAKEWVSIPNIMGYFRILLVPVFVTVFLRADDPRDYIVSGTLVAISYITDILDGFVARRFNQVTELGILIDPLADKITQGMILIMLLVRNRKLVPLMVLFGVKEGFMAVMGLVMMGKGKRLMGAEWYGKLSTGVFDCAMIVVLFGHGRLPGWMETGIYCVTGFFMALSLVLYARLYYRMAKGSPSVLDQKDD